MLYVIFVILLGLIKTQVKNKHKSITVVVLIFDRMFISMCNGR